MKIVSPNGLKIVVGNLFDENDRYKMYTVFLENDRPAILKVANTVEQNGDLDREALVIKKLRDRAKEIDAGLPQGEGFNYHQFFPKVEETFIYEPQGNRRLNVYSFSRVCTKLSDLESIDVIVKVRNKYVDPKTGGWIFRKFLKALDFVHKNGFTFNQLPSFSLLVNLREHYVCFVDLVSIKVHDGKPSVEDLKRDVSTLAKKMHIIMGGRQDVMGLPNSNQLKDKTFERLIWGFTQNLCSSARDAHNRLMKQMDEMWGVKFHEYTLHEREI